MGEATPSRPEPRAPRLIVGLGNPGAKYRETRHNVGFLTLDLFATRIGASPTGLKAGGQRLGDFYRSPEGGFALLWPSTFMNLSGGAVVAAQRQLDTDPESILVITDDFHLPLGALRVRAQGSTGGHNGLASIEAALGTQDYSRLRIGVGDPGGNSVEFVLSRFRRGEKKAVEETLETSSWAAEDWAGGISIEDLQARYNRRKP